MHDQHYDAAFIRGKYRRNLSVNRSSENRLTHDLRRSCFLGLVSFRHVLALRIFLKFCFMSSKYHLSKLRLFSFRIHLFFVNTMFLLMRNIPNETAFHEMLWKKSFTVYPCLKTSSVLCKLCAKWAYFDYLVLKWLLFPMTRISHLSRDYISNIQYLKEILVSFL